MSRGHRQSPGIVSVEAHEVRAKGFVKFNQIVRQPKHQPELCRDHIAFIPQQVEFQVIFLGHLPQVRLAHRRYGHQCCPRRLNFLQAFL